MWFMEILPDDIRLIHQSRLRSVPTEVDALMAIHSLARSICALSAINPIRVAFSIILLLAPSDESLATSFASENI
jgi:hypothetical protein